MIRVEPSEAPEDTIFIGYRVIDFANILSVIENVFIGANKIVAAVVGVRRPRGRRNVAVKLARERREIAGWNLISWEGQAGRRINDSRLSGEISLQFCRCRDQVRFRKPFPNAQPIVAEEEKELIS